MKYTVTLALEVNVSKHKIIDTISNITAVIESGKIDNITKPIKVVCGTATPHKQGRPPKASKTPKPPIPHKLPKGIPYNPQ